MIELTSEFKKRSTALAVPRSFFDSDLRAWCFDPEGDDRAAQIAMRLFPHVRELLPREQVERIESSQNLGRFDAATSWADGQKPEELLPNVPAEILELLYPYQLTDLGYLAARMRVDGAGYLAWDRGLGKTLGAITLAYTVDADRVLVVTPSLSKTATWLPEFTKWDVAHKWSGRIYDVGNTPAQRERAVDVWRRDGGVLLCHYEAVRLIEPLLGTGKSRTEPDLVVVDEAHRLARGSASASAPSFYKALKRIKPRFKLLLSGSVVINSPEDIFGGIHYMFPSVYGSKWRDWNDKYLHYVDGGFGKVLVGVKPASLPRMREELSQFMCVRDKLDELPGLPDRLERTVEIALSPVQQRVYTELADSYMATLDGDTILVSTQLAQLAKLRQLATGLNVLSPDYDDESSKFDYAVQLIEDTLPRKTVVFCWHRAAVDALVDRLRNRGMAAAGIHGGVAQKDRTDAVHAFQNDADPQVLVATIKTLGESVTLHRSSDVIFVESSWTDADMQQAADRVYRIGQEHRVTITHIVAKGTVDTTKVLPAVVSKADMRRMIFGGPVAVEDAVTEAAG